MRIVDITVMRTLPDPETWRRATVNAWLDRTVAELMGQLTGYFGPHRIWIGENGTFQIEPIDQVASPAGAHPPAAAHGAEPGEGRADPPSVQPHGPITYCGN